MSDPLILPWLLCSCLFSAVTLAALYLKRKMNGFVPGDKSPPSLPSLPIIGSLLSLVTDSPPHIFFQQLQKKYGDLYSLMMGSHKVLIVNNHHHAKEILIKKGKIFAGRPRTVSKLHHFHQQLNFTKLFTLLYMFVFKVTTDLLTRGGKDIAFADYSSTWKYHRKMVHGALCMFGEGAVSIEKISEYHCSQHDIVQIYKSNANYKKIHTKIYKSEPAT